MGILSKNKTKTVSFEYNSKRSEAEVEALAATLDFLRPGYTPVERNVENAKKDADKDEANDASETDGKVEDKKADASKEIEETISNGEKSEDLKTDEKKTSIDKPELIELPASGNKGGAVSLPTSGNKGDAVSLPTSGNKGGAVSLPTSGNKGAAPSLPTSGNKSGAVSLPTSGNKGGAVSLPTSGNKGAAVSLPTSTSRGAAVSLPTGAADEQKAIQSNEGTKNIVEISTSENKNETNETVNVVETRLAEETNSAIMPDVSKIQAPNSESTSNDEIESNSDNITESIAPPEIKEEAVATQVVSENEIISNPAVPPQLADQAKTAVPIVKYGRRMDYKTAVVTSRSANSLILSKAEPMKPKTVSISPDNKEPDKTGKIHNPLPQPKQHIQRSLEFDYSPNDAEMHFDLDDIKGREYFDIN